jgi:hypothetical protein
MRACAPLIWTSFVCSSHYCCGQQYKVCRSSSLLTLLRPPVTFIFLCPKFYSQHPTFKHLQTIPIAQPKRCTCYFKLFILVKRSICFGRSFRPSSGAQNCVYSNGICQTPAALRGEVERSSISSPIAGGSSSCLTYTVAVYAVLSSWWWTERPSETCSAFYKNK